jgi:hypothetical protein
MNIFVVFKLARQIQGEYVLVQTLGAFKSATEADQLAKQHLKGVELVSTPDGNVECFCEVGVHQTELVGD